MFVYSFNKKKSIIVYIAGYKGGEELARVSLKSQAASKLPRVLGRNSNDSLISFDFDFDFDLICTHMNTFSIYIVFLNGPILP